MSRFNKGTQLGDLILEKSLKSFGGCRSAVVDKNGDPIIGEKVLKKAKELGIPIKVVETDGSVLVVVKRTDLTASSRKSKEIEFIDNLSSEQGLSWNNEYILETMNTEWGFDPRNYGVKMSLDKELSIEDFFTEVENQKGKQKASNESVVGYQPSLFDDII